MYTEEIDQIFVKSDMIIMLIFSDIVYTFQGNTWISLIGDPFF